ncbi:SDR family oxidoreductase [Opitutales bacterium]|nr:SDR family oxidoreductase [Opitutales bacterium]
MSQTITILGCGYLGSALAKQCISKGWTVSALTRNSAKAKDLRAMGVDKVIEAQIEDENWHDQLDSSQDFVVNCVGAASSDAQGYISSYIEGQDSVMKWLQQGSVKTFVFTSSTSVYPQSGKRFVDETASCVGVSEKGGLLLAAEQKCFPPVSSISRSFILRLSGLYGPGRHLLMNKVKQGEDIDGNEDRILNLIHRDDAANAVISCLQADKSNLGRIYNVSDGTHATRGQIVAWLAESLNLSTPSFKGDDEEGTPNRKVSNNRILDDLSWSPEYSNYQLGYQSIFENL